MKKINNMTVFEPTDKCSLDEYSQKAAIEVPELIKKAKEEVNQKVIEISENDIKQDNEILELKTNYTNLQEQNTKLESQIKKDRENMINLEVEGQSIHIEDSSDLEGKLEILGNVEQDVREGYNILENILTDKTVNGITVKINKDKSITLNGTATENTSLDITKNFTITEQSIFSGMCDGYGYNKMLIQIQGSDYNVNIPNSTPQALQPKDNVKVRIYIYAGTNITNAMIKPQINKGTVAKSYEQYGVSPSPEYPSEIRAVGDNINLLEITAKTTTVNGVTFTVNEDGTVIANGTAGTGGINFYISNGFELEKGEYILTSEKNPTSSKYFTYIDPINVSTAGNYKFVLEEKSLLKARIVVREGQVLNNVVFYPKLEKGRVATSYSKFGQGSVGIKKINKNLAPNLKEGKLEKQNTFICNCKKGESFTLSTKGTAEKDGRLFLRTNTDFAEGTDSYAEQKEITLNGTEQKITITSTIDGFLYIRTGGAAHVYNFTYLQIEKGIVATEYIEHQEQTKILPIQKPMLEGDHFNRTDNKEVHTWKKIMLDGVNNKVTQETTATNGKYRYKYTDKDLKNCSLSEEKAYCTHLQLIEKNKTYDKIVGFTVSNGSLLIYTDGDTAVNFNAKLQKENYIFYIPVIESAYEKIDLTLEQTKVLDELDNFPTYKPVTNITTDSIAKIKLKYIADTKTYVDNKTSNLEQQVNTINQLLSTTKTSSVLLDNLQSDIESEVL